MDVSRGNGVADTEEPIGAIGVRADALVPPGNPTSSAPFALARDHARGISRRRLKVVARVKVVPPASRSDPIAALPLIDR
jgi:hypothetical protein